MDPKLLAEINGIKAVVTVMLDQWVSVQRDPTAALAAFTESLQSFVARMDLSGVPEEHRKAFREHMGNSAMTMVQSSAGSYPMDISTSQQ